MGMSCPICGHWANSSDVEEGRARLLAEARSTSWVFAQLIEVLNADNGCHHQVTWPDFLAAEPQIKALQTAGFFADDPDDLDGSFWQMASGEHTERQGYFAACREPFSAMSKILDAIFDRPPEREDERDEIARKAEAYDAISTPKVADFLSAVENEALHQRDRWGVDHDAGKRNEDWIALLTYLIGKATKSHYDGDADKLLHHVITTAAVCLNWHAALTGVHTRMRPGIAPAQTP